MVEIFLRSFRYFLAGEKCAVADLIPAGHQVLLTRNVSSLL